MGTKTVAIVGLGEFGQFLGRSFWDTSGVRVVATSRTNYSLLASEHENTTSTTCPPTLTPNLPTTSTATPVDEKTQIDQQYEQLGQHPNNLVHTKHAHTCTHVPTSAQSLKPPPTHKDSPSNAPTTTSTVPSTTDFVVHAYYTTAAEMLNTEHPDLILFTTSIYSLDTVLTHFPWELCKAGCVATECCSVKVYPKTIVQRQVPPSISFFLSHPMFGPNSAGTQASDRWTGLRLVYDSLSVANDDPNYAWILNWFANRGCVLIEMPAETHDKQAAQTQFLTHFLARSLPLVETQIDTLSYIKLKRAITMVSADSDDLFEAMYRTNTTHCNALLDTLEESIRAKRKQLSALGSL